MKIFICLVVLLCSSISLLGQEEESGYFLETDSTWIKELFHFPISFAPTIEYSGIEDARFPAGWSKEGSDEFWSYVFAWRLDLDRALTVGELEKSLQLYFDGLMKIDRKESLLSTTVVFVKNHDINGDPAYVGKIRTIDSFFTKKPMTLNVLVYNHHCDSSKKHITLFRFSPKGFENDVWNKLKDVKLSNNICDY